MADQNEAPIRWIKVQFITEDGELAEALADVIGRFASNGVAVESVTKFDEHTQENLPTGKLAVSGYIPVDEYIEETRQKLEEALWYMGRIAPSPSQPTAKSAMKTGWRPGRNITPPSPLVRSS